MSTYYTPGTEPRDRTRTADAKRQSRERRMQRRAKFLAVAL